MRVRIWAVVGIVAAIAILVVAWIMGDAQPTRWIETPVAAPVSGSATGSPSGAAAELRVQL